MKQTAVEWLWEQYNNECDCGGDVEYTLAEKLFEQAKAMEKEQSFEIFKAGQESMEEGGKGFEQYYNEIYKSE